MNNGNPNTNSGGLTYIPAISTGALYVNNKRLRDIILELQSSISLNQDQITGINSFLARLDLQITDPNILTLTNDNRNQVLKQLIDALNTKTNYLDTTAITSSWVLTEANKNSVLKSSVDALNTKTNYLDTTAITSSWVLTEANKNSVLKSSVDALNTKTNYLDTTSITSSWTVNETNKNSVLKSSVDSLNSTVGTLNTKTNYITSQTGNNSTNPKTKSIFGVNVEDKDETNLYLQSSALNYVSVNSNLSNPSSNNVTIASAAGKVELTANNIKINPFNGGDTIDIGKFGISNTGQINIGGSLSKINIGSYEDPIFATTVGALGYNDNTIITIGKRTTLKNTLTYLNGNINTADSRLISLSVTDVVTWELLASWFSGFALSNAPYWLDYFAISGTPNYRYSDVIKMAGNYQTGGLTKNGSIETSNDLGLKKLTVIDTSVVGLSTAFDALLQRLCFQAFAVHGSHSIGSIWGQTDIYAGSGNVIMRCDGGAWDWAFKNAGNTNYVKVSNLDTEVIQCNGSGGNGTLKLGAFNGNIDMYVGTAGTQASGTKVIQVKSTKQVIIGDNDTQANRYDATTKLIIDHTNLNDGLKVCKAGSASITRINYDNINTPSINVTTLVPGSITGWNVKSLVSGSGITLSNNSGEYTINSTVAGGGGITFLISNPTTVTNTTANITMSSTYTSASTTSIIKNSYTAGLTYNLAIIKSGYIPTGNPILSGTYEANIYANYQGNQPATLYSKLFVVSETTNLNNYYLIDKGYTGSSGSGQVQALKTKLINVPQVPAPFINSTPNLTIDIGIITFPNVSVSTSTTLNFRCGLFDSAGTQMYTYPDLYGYGYGTYNLTFTPGTIPTTIEQINLTYYYFQMYIISSTGAISQVSARGANDANYSFTGRVKMLLYDVFDNTTALTYNVSNLYSLTVPVKTCDVTDFTTFSKIQYEIYFKQISGSTSGHSISLLFNDGYLSHLHTNINIVPGSAVVTPTLAQVLTTSNSSGGNEINMNGNAIRGISALIPLTGPSWNVRALTAGTNITITNDNAGTYTINSSGGGGTQNYQHVLCIESMTSGTNYGMPTINLQLYDYYINFEITNSWFNNSTFISFNNVTNPFNYNVQYLPTSVSGTINYEHYSGSSQASDAGTCPFFYSPNNGSFYLVNCNLTFKMSALKSNVTILSQVGEPHYTHGEGGGYYGGKGVAGGLANWVGADARNICGEYNYKTMRFYLPGNNDTWGPTGIKITTGDTEGYWGCKMNVSRTAKNINFI